MQYIYICMRFVRSHNIYRVELRLAKHPANAPVLRNDIYIYICTSPHKAKQEDGLLIIKLLFSQLMCAAPQHSPIINCVFVCMCVCVCLLLCALVRGFGGTLALCRI